MAKLLETIERVKQSLNPNLKMRGFVLTMYDKRTYLARVLDNTE